MSFLTTQLLTHRRQISTTVLTPTLSSINDFIIPNVQTTILSKTANFHTTTTLQRPGYKPPRNPKIGITLEQLRMAARGTGRRLPICHDEMEKVMNSLEAAKYENHAIYKYVKEYDKCREDYELNHKGKDKVMMKELNKYLVRKRKK